MMDITQMQHGAILRGHQVNASANRERKRQQRLLRLVVWLGVPLVWFWYRFLSGNPIRLGMPPVIQDNPQFLFLGIMLVMIGGMMLIPMLSSASRRTPGCGRAIRPFVLPTLSAPMPPVARPSTH